MAMAMALRLSSWTLSVAMVFIACTTSLAAADSHGGGAHFSYAGPTAPAHWGSLDKSFAGCSNEKLQSPIDIKKDKVAASPNLKPLQSNYKAANTMLVNTGHSVKVRIEGQIGGINVNGKLYRLINMHWHTPSEHLIDGKQSAAELHAVHTAADRSLAVVGRRYTLGAPDGLVKMIEEKLRILAKNESKEVPLGTLDIKNLNLNEKFYRYTGSLTTPPCTGGVIWNVIDKEFTISEEQIGLLKAPLGADFKNNFRPVQPINGRKIEVCNKK